MMVTTKILICLPVFSIYCLVIGVLGAELPTDLPSKDKVARGEVQSCSGCSLKRLPDVRRFIHDDIPKYEGLEFKQDPGAPPYLVLFDKSDKELQRIALSPFSREQCNDLARKWFKLKEKPESAKDTREEL